MRYDLVIFDCDGVLIDSEIISATMLIKEVARLGVEIDLSYVAQNFLGRSYPTVMETLRREFHLELPPTFEEQYRERLLAAFETELRVMPGVRQVVDELAVPYCVATSSSLRRAETSLRIAGLGDLIGPRLFTASQVAQGKPAPDLFLFAAAKMGAKPQNVLVIEDSLTGIRAAHAAGMSVWRFVGGSHLRQTSIVENTGPLPELQFASFAEFFQIAPQMRRHE